jgi:hypothetical protein
MSLLKSNPYSAAPIGQSEPELYTVLLELTARFNSICGLCPCLSRPYPCQALRSPDRTLYIFRIPTCPCFVALRATSCHRACSAALSVLNYCMSITYYINVLYTYLPAVTIMIGDLMLYNPHIKSYIG